MYNISNPELINCTFYKNIASVSGGGIRNSSSVPTSITNCIFWNDLPNEMYNVTLTNVSYSDIQNWTSGGTSNINSDPCFADAANPSGLDGVFGTWDDGLRIMAYSKCVDKANGNPALSTDMTGRARVDVPYADNINVGPLPISVLMNLRQSGSLMMMHPLAVMASHGDCLQISPGCF